MLYVCETAKVLLNKLVRAVKIPAYIWEVAGSNLACGTGCLESLHAFPHSYQADSRIVDLP